MRKNIKKILLALMVSTQAYAQTEYVHQVIVLNEGRYGGPVTLGTYNPSTKIYSQFDLIHGARFASDVLIDGGFIYVAADKQLVKYDLYTLKKVQSRLVRGIRKLAVWNNQIVATRGEMQNSLITQFQVFDKHTFSLLYEKTLKGNAEGVIIKDDKAYIAVNCWGDCGYLTVINLNTRNLENEINLGAQGLNPENVMEHQGIIYSLNNLDWTSSSITVFNPISGGTQTIALQTPSSCSASMVHLGTIYYQANTTKHLGRFDLSSLAVKNPLDIQKTLYAMDADKINSLLYISETDFQSYGKVHIFDFAGNYIESFDAGISPGNLAFDIRTTAGPAKMTLGQETIVEKTTAVSIKPFSPEIYPNPANSVVTININGNTLPLKLSLSNILDKIVFEQYVGGDQKSFLLNIEDYPRGVYFLKIQTTEEMETHKIVIY